MMVDPIKLEIFKNKFSAIAEEMGVTLNRTAFSPNIKERRDYSCAIFNASGDMVNQAAHIPVHLGSMPMSVKAAIQNVSINPGDMIILNDPFKGGTHLPDVTIVAPVFTKEDSTQPLFYVANRAHHADIGGMSAGSMPLSRSIYQEGLIIPALKIMKNYQIDEDVLSLILSNVRTKIERQGDFAAQFMANKIGIRRISELIEKNSQETVVLYSKALMEYSEKIMRKTLKIIPNGLYLFEDYLDSDGVDDEKIKIKVGVEIKEDQAIIDFTGSSKQIQGSVNAVYAITASACLYVFRALVKENIPANAGCMSPLTIITQPGSIVDATYPAAVAGGNVETSQRIVDCVLGALSQAVPEKIPAASQGTMNNLTIGGIKSDSGQAFAYYETMGGGTGASLREDGENAIQSHMTNTLNTPVEAIEYEYPFRITNYAIRHNSGGNGLHKGGNGLIREFTLLNDAECTMLSERRKFSPYGLFGGENGKAGNNLLIYKDKQIKQLPGKFSLFLKKGDKLRIETPGGGGFKKAQ
jgi:N-methylhydantoinase B